MFSSPCDSSSTGLADRTFGLLASGFTTVRSIGRAEVSLDIVVLGLDIVVLGRHRSSTVVLLLMLLLSREVKGDSIEGLFSCWLLFDAMEKRRELARKGLLARRGERR